MSFRADQPQIVVDQRYSELKFSALNSTDSILRRLLWFFHMKIGSPKIDKVAKEHWIITKCWWNRISVLKIVSQSHKLQSSIEEWRRLESISNVHPTGLMNAKKVIFPPHILARESWTAKMLLLASWCTVGWKSEFYASTQKFQIFWNIREIDEKSVIPNPRNQR